MSAMKPNLLSINFRQIILDAALDADTGRLPHGFLPGDLESICDLEEVTDEVLRPARVLARHRRPSCIPDRAAAADERQVTNAACVQSLPYTPTISRLTA